MAHLLIKMQTKNLFDIPLDVETPLEENTQINMNDIEIGSGISPFKLQSGGGGSDSSFRKVDLESQSDFADLDEVNLDQMSEFDDIETIQKGGDLNLFDKIEVNSETYTIFKLSNLDLNNREVELFAIQD